MGQAMVQHAAAAAGGAAAAAGSKKVADSLEKILGGVASTTATAAAKPPAPAVAPTATAGKRGKPSPFEPQVNRAGGSEMAPVMNPGMVRQSAIPSPSEVEAIVSGESLPGNSWVSRKPVHQAPVPAFTPFVTNDAPAVSRGSRPAGTGSQMAETMVAVPAVAMPIPMIVTAVIPPPPAPVRATPEKFAAIQTGASYETILSELGTPASKIEMMEDGKVLESLRIEVNGNKIGTIRLVNGLVTSIEPVSN